LGVSHYFVPAMLRFVIGSTKKTSLSWLMNTLINSIRIDPFFRHDTITLSLVTHHHSCLIRSLASQPLTTTLIMRKSWLWLVETSNGSGLARWMPAAVTWAAVTMNRWSSKRNVQTNVILGTVWLLAAYFYNLLFRLFHLMQIPSYHHH
jgi:hypothetical protein